MKKIFTIIFFSFSLLGFAKIENKNVNFNYDDFVGYYVENDEIGIENNSVKLHIYKDKNGDLYFGDWYWTYGSGFDGIVTYTKLMKKDNKLFSKHMQFILKDGLVYYISNDRNIDKDDRSYIKINNKIGDGKLKDMKDVGIKIKFVKK